MSARTLSFMASLIALSALSVSAAFAQQGAPPQNPNPTNNADVQAGYDRTRQEILDRRAQEGSSNGTSTAPSATAPSATAPSGADRSEHDHGHNACPDASVCSNQSTYKNDPNTPSPEPD
jgi:cytoskeletal protein RodZ